MDTSRSIIAGCIFTVAISTVLVGCVTNQQMNNLHKSMSNYSILRSLQTNNKTLQVDIESNEKTYKAGDEMIFDITSNVQGKVWLLQVDAADDVSVLYPFQAGQNNAIPAYQTVQLLSPYSNKAFYADKPYGHLAILAIVAMPNKSLNEIVTIDNGKLIKVAFDGENDWNAKILKLRVNE